MARANSPTDAWHVRVYAVMFLLVLGVRAGTVPMVAFTQDTCGGKRRRSSGEITSGAGSLLYISPWTVLLLLLVAIAFLN